MKNSLKIFIFSFLISILSFSGLQLFPFEKIGMKDIVYSSVLVEGSIAQDTTWTIEMSPIIIHGTVTVNSGVTLTIEPGVTVKFKSKNENERGKLVVNGTLVANGTSDNSIFFTSFKDDSAGGDTNNDGDATIPQPGDWEYLYFYKSKGTLNYAQVRYGGYYPPVGHFGGNIVCYYGADIEIISSVVEKSMNYGLYSTKCSPIIKHSKFNGNWGGMYFSGYPSSPYIENNEIKDNTILGIFFTSDAYGNIFIKENNIEGNDIYGIYNGNLFLIIDTTYNWWGDDSGPYHPIANPQGKGDRVSDRVLFDPWIKKVMGWEFNISVILTEPFDIQHNPMYNKGYFENLTNLIKDYHYENSFERVNLDFTIFDNDEKWYKLSQTESYYADNREKELVKEAEALVGIIPGPPQGDHIIVVVHAGTSSQREYPNAFWKKKITTQTWAKSNEIVVAGDDKVGGWAHEISHALGVKLTPFNTTIPDLYGMGNVGKWDLMATGSWNNGGSNPPYMSSYTKEFLEWLESKEITEGTYWIDSLDTSEFGDDIFKYNISDNEYYILEVRNNTGNYNNKWDTSVPETALVLYLVDTKGFPEYGYDPEDGIMWNQKRIINIPSKTFWEDPFMFWNNGVISPPPEKEAYWDLDHLIKFTVIDVEEFLPTSYQIKANIEKINADFFKKRFRGIILRPKAFVNEKTQRLFQGTPPLIPFELPDIDLHVYTDDGRHVGINYATGEYEIGISGTLASGDLDNGHEWILLPEGVADYHFIVSSFTTGEFLKEFPEAQNYTDGVDSYEIYGFFVDPVTNIFKSVSITQEIEPGIQLEHSITETYDITVSSGEVTIESIIGEIYQYFNLGWIDNSGIKNSLLSKLDNAKRKIKANQKKAAANILDAFLKEVEAQRDKHIKIDAATVLIKNTKSIINNL